MAENEIPIPDPQDASDGLLDQTSLPPDHRSGFIALVGRPNVGKSTLMNQLIGERLAIVTAKAQTTRRRMLGILTRADLQIVFMDTPGVHKPLDALGVAMVRAAEGSIRDADVVVVLIDASDRWTDEDQRAVETVQRTAAQEVILVLNKVDALATREALVDRAAAVQAYFPEAPILTLSALTGEGTDLFLEEVARKLPFGPRFFPEDQLADWPLRDVATEMIREQVLLRLHQEVPYAVEVWLESWVDEAPDLTSLHAVLYVERDSQKGIVIGRGGKMLKQITQGARRSLETLLEHRVNLRIHVRVQPSWRKDQSFLKRLGLT